MIGLPESVRIMLFTEPTDMRKGFDGLGGLVAAAGEDIYQGHLYVFLSRRRDVRILARPVSASVTGRVAIDATELAMLLDGIDVARVQRARHWRPKKRSEGIDTIAAL